MPQKRYLTQRYPESEKVKETGRRRAHPNQGLHDQEGRRDPAPGAGRAVRSEADRQRSSQTRRSTLPLPAYVQSHHQASIRRRGVLASHDPQRELPRSRPRVPPCDRSRARSDLGSASREGCDRVARFVCRYIDGTDTVSRHGFIDPRGAWKGAAEDVFIDGDMGDLVAMARAIVDAAEEGVLDLDTVIVNRMIWTSGTGVWHEYNGAVHYHVHVDKLAGEPCRP